MQLSAARTNNGWSANPIGYHDIFAWAMLMRTNPSPWEVNVLRRMDGAYLSGLAAKQEAGRDRSLVEVSAEDADSVSAIMGSLKAKAGSVYKG